MKNSTSRSRYETQLARSHRSLYWAMQVAEELGDEGAVHDCKAILLEIARLTEDSLKNGSRASRARARRAAEIQSDDL